MGGDPAVDEKAQKEIVVLAKRETVASGDLAVGDEPPFPIAIGDVFRRIRFERRNLTSDLFGRKLVVGIEPLDVCALGELEGAIAGEGLSLLVAGFDLDLVPLSAPQLFGQARTAVGRIVVDENDLDVWIGLREAAFQARSQHRPRVVTGDEDRDQRSHGEEPSAR